MLNESSEDLQLDEAAIAAFAEQLIPSAVQSSAVYVRLPIRFDSAQAEVNYLVLFHLLDFGSGFDALLLQKARRDAHEVIQFGLLGMLMSDVRLDHHFLREFSSFQVFSYFNVDASEEQQVMPGITMTRTGPLGDFTQLIKDTMNETGRILGGTGCRDLGEFVMSFVDSRRALGEAPSAAALIEKLAATFPGYDDRAECGGLQVSFYRKAQALAAQLCLRFGKEDERFAFQDVSSLAVDSGNVVPAMLRHHGILRYSDAMASVVDAGEDLYGVPKEAVLRAATVEAGARICKAAGTVFEPYQLSQYLLMGLARPEYKDLKKHVAKGTVAY
ncbi:hypothetical protein N2152v2_010658 [Parachlorella kessleri]